MTRDWDFGETDFARRGPISCPPPALVLGSERGELPDDLAAPIAAHVAGCLLCRTLAQDLALLHSAGPSLAEEQRVLHRIKTGSRRTWLIPAIAACAAAAVLAALLLPGIVPLRTVPKPNPPLAVAAPLPQTPARPLIPKPPVMLPGSVLLFRGQPGNGNQQAMLQAFATAIAPYREDRYDEAVVRLETFTKDYPAMPEGFFYLGVSRMLAGHKAEARLALEQAGRLSRKPFLDQVERYLQLSQ